MPAGRTPAEKTHELRTLCYKYWLKDNPHICRACSEPLPTANNIDRVCHEFKLSLGKEGPLEPENVDWIHTSCVYNYRRYHAL